MTKPSLCTARYFNDNPISLRELIINSFYEAQITFRPHHVPQLHLSSSLARRSHLALEPNFSLPPSKPSVSQQGSKPQRTSIHFHVLAGPFRGQMSYVSFPDCAIFQQQYTLIDIILFIYKWHNITAIHHRCVHSCVCPCLHEHIQVSSPASLHRDEKGAVRLLCARTFWQVQGS